jgi:hypothetical protein
MSKAPRGNPVAGVHTYLHRAAPGIASLPTPRSSGHALGSTKSEALFQVA